MQLFFFYTMDIEKEMSKMLERLLPGGSLTDEDRNNISTLLYTIGGTRCEIVFIENDLDSDIASGLIIDDVAASQYAADIKSVVDELELYLKLLKTLVLASIDDTTEKSIMEGIETSQRYINRAKDLYADVLRAKHLL